MALLLIGEFELTIDAKHRLSIPSALRESIDPDHDGEDFILVLGAERHLCLYPGQYYRRMLGKLKRSPLPTRQQRKLDLFFAMARRLKPDSQGRVVLPEKSMQRAAVSNRVTLVGRLDHIEIWPREEWDTYVAGRLPTSGDDLLDAGDQVSPPSE